MTDDELILELDRKCIALVRQGLAAPAAAGRRIANALRIAVKDHQAALDEATRLRKLMKSAKGSTDSAATFAVAQATTRDRWRVVTTTRENALHFLNTTHHSRTP